MDVSTALKRESLVFWGVFFLVVSLLPFQHAVSRYYCTKSFMALKDVFSQEKLVVNRQEISSWGLRWKSGMMRGWGGGVE